MLDFNGKVAIVTGGSRGIGKGIAQVLARQGAMVAILDILDKEGAETIAEIKAAGGKAAFHKCDVTRREQVDAAVAAIVKQYQKIDVLVGNAGFDKMELFLKLDPSWWDKLIDLNYKHFIYIHYAVLPIMMKQNYGRIVNIGSDAGRGGSSGEAVYSGCKGAVIAFSKTIAREFARFNVTVNVVCPGPTTTPLSLEQRKEEFAGKIINAVERAIPLRRFGEPVDIANAVAFLASDEASYITGQVLSVSGGLTMF